MEDLSLAALKSLILAHQMLTTGILTLLASAVLVWKYWEQVSYFLLRIWHSFPLIGTVARLSRKPSSVDSDGWINHEVKLAGDYYQEFKKYMKGPNAYNASLDYLAKAGEAGRSPRPAWVLFLVVGLVLIEAMGFAYVLAGWMNMDASTNDRHLLTAGTAILLAVASAIFAEAAGHTVHHNTLISRARHWWQGEETSKRSRSLKASRAINLEDSLSDSNSPDYEQLLTRVKDVNSNVSRKFLWLIVCGVFVACMAIGAFVVRSATLDSIETEMVNSMRVEASAQNDSSFGSPFDLPEESQAINDEAQEATIEDKMAAIRQASLTTYIMLSLIYIAIQGISIWLASRYYFAGTHSYTAWRLTHKYATAEEMMDAMEQKRIAIASHADDKLRRLQTLLSSRDQTSSSVLSALDGTETSHRNFLAYVKYKADKVTQKTVSSEALTPTKAPVETVTVIEAEAPVVAKTEPAVAMNSAELPDVTSLSEESLTTGSPIQAEPIALAPEQTQIPAGTATVVDVQAPLVAKTEPNATIKASDFPDVTGVSDESLAVTSRALDISEEQLREYREQQLALKALGLFPAKKEEAMS
ncbi:conserved membrane protein of unknown function [Pseudomonas marincola]|uniref:Uncharacterized protein n=1 Tax=Pseudomonas marincola TaxID=437900 RepID=A0A653E1J0_9PSED|nr:hypothetical protein [Pseudomonas marincola]CAE6880056.1 conserved membrane protein of unknown function [Pseudomonas marincola]